MNKNNRMDRKEAPLGDGAFSKMFLVTLVGMMVSLLTNVVDSIVTGQFLGSKAVAAMGLVAPVMSFTLVVTNLLVAGTSQLCARSFGKADVRKVNQIFSTMAVCSAALCTITGAAVFFLSPIYLAAVGREADGEILRMALDYLHGFAFFFLPMGLMNLLNTLMVLDNDQKQSMGVAWILLVSDLVLDLVNVLVFHGGLLGMALATVFSVCLALFWLLLHFRQPGHLLEFTPNDLCFGVIASVQATTEIAAGLAYGEEDASGIERVLKNSLSLSCRAYLAMGLILFAFAHPIAGIFLDDSSAGIQQMAATFIRFATLQYAMTIACYSLTGILAGTGHVWLNYTRVR